MRPAERIVLLGAATTPALKSKVLDLFPLSDRFLSFGFFMQLERPFYIQGQTVSRLSGHAGIELGLQ